MKIPTSGFQELVLGRPISPLFWYSEVFQKQDCKSDGKNQEWSSWLPQGLLQYVPQISAKSGDIGSIPNSLAFWGALGLSARTEGFPSHLRWKSRAGNLVTPEYSVGSWYSSRRPAFPTGHPISFMMKQVTELGTAIGKNIVTLDTCLIRAR